MHSIRVFAAGGLLAAAVCAQTRVDLSSQARNVDFSTATSTRPSKTGTVLPAMCRVGETFFKTDAAPGANLWGCVAENVWSRLGADPGTSLPSGQQQGMALFTNGASVEWDRAVKSLSTGNGAGLVVVCANGVDAVSGNCQISGDSAYMATQSGNNTFLGTTVFPPGAVQTISSGATELRVNATSIALQAASDVTLTAALPEGVTGQILYVVNTGAGVITMQDESVQPGSNLRLSAGTVPLGSGQGMTLLFAGNKWIQLGGGVTVNSGSSAVASVFGRTGAVVKAEGDYSTADLSDADGKQGTGSKLQAFGGGSVNANDCAKFDASGNIVSAGAACGGTSTVASVFGRTGAVVKAEGDYSTADLSDADGKQGTGSKLQAFGGGSVNANDCAKFDASGNIVSAGAACGSGGGAAKAFVAAGGTSGFTPVSSTTSSTIATATLPAGSLSPGDHLVIRAVLLHEGGTAVSPRVTLQFGGTNLTTDVALAATDTFGYLEADVVVGSGGQNAITKLTRSNGVQLAPVRSVAAAALNSDISVRFNGRMTSTTTESLTLEWYSIDVVKP